MSPYPAEHQFYGLPEEQRRAFQLRLGAIVAVGLLACGALFYVIWPGLLVVIFLAMGVTLSVVAPFFDVPAMVRRGKLRYYAPFLLAEPVKDGVMTLHGGTLFDYYFTLAPAATGAQRRRRVVRGYLEGLLAILDDQPDPVVLRGTSYIIRQATAKRLGFRSVPTEGLRGLVLILNFLPLTVSLSYVRRTLTWPRLRRMSTFEATVGELRTHRAYLETVLRRLDRS